jgi:putative ABC transport system permease protein
MRNLSHILRRFGRAPGFTAIVLLTLAIGIGANTAIFSVINGVLIKPLPYPAAQELIGVWHVAPGINLPGPINCSPTMYFTYRSDNQTFQHVGVWQGGAASVTGINEPEQVRTVQVTDGILQALSVPPLLGRWFTQADDTPGTAETVILTYGYWQRRLGGDKNVVGRGITIDSRPREIIGVMPASFQFLNIGNAELLLPLRFDRNRVFLGNFSYQGVARLKPGVTLAQANADVGRMLGIWINAWPAPPGFDRKLFTNARLGPAVRPLIEDVVGDAGGVLWILMGTIGIVLLIACANVANLLLVRAEGRQQELAIRAALGAGWGRIARDLMLESVVLGLAGGVLGLGLAYAGLRLLVWIGPASLPRLNEISMDPRVLAFALAASLFSGLVFGLVPVLKYAGPQIAGALRGGGRTLSQSRERHRARNTLVVVQVALALVLLVASGLMIRSFRALRSVQPGFARPEQVQLARISIPEAQVKDPMRVTRMQNDILDKLRAIPGVAAAAFTNSAPMEPFNSNDLVFAQDKVYAPGEIPPIRRFKFVSPGLFATVGTRVIAGRDYTWTDLYDQRQVAVVSENFARELWREPSAALGKRIREGMTDPWREIVGVVGDVYDNGVHQKAASIVYWPALMDNFWGSKPQVMRGVTFAIRSGRTGTEGFLKQVREAVWSVNPNLPLSLVRSLGDVYDASMARTSFTLVMLAIAAAMAMILGIVGIYGVISFAVSQRTREIGIRSALGAQNGALQRMFVRYGLILAALGVVIGIGAAAGLTRLMSSLLFGIAPLDPATYGAVSVVLVSSAVLASYLPARRASEIDPVDALRAE